MDGYEVKEVMEQVHISSQMQEEIIMNVQKRMENRNKNGNKNTRAWNWKRMAVAAAAVVLAAGVVSFPVRAFVTSVVKERMESVPKEEMQSLNNMLQSQHDVQADGFSREYSDSEKERSKELWQAYENGTFPEKVIAQADNAKDAPEGMLCYIRSTGVFHLPAQEMTDEEILEIIDFQNKMSYVVEQGQEAQTAADIVNTQEQTVETGSAANSRTQEEVDEENRKERAMLEEKVQAAGGLSEEQAIEIARKALESDLGERGKKLKLTTDGIYGWSSDLCVADWSEIKEEDRGGIAYSIAFNNAESVMDLKELHNYVCVVNAVDGSILEAYEIHGLDGEAVYYEH